MNVNQLTTLRRTVRYSIATLAVMSIAGGVVAAANPTEVDASFANSAQGDLSTRVHMRITNNTGEPLVLTKKEHGGVGVHWQAQPVDLQPSQVETIDVYASSDPSIDVTYTGQSSGRVFELHGKTPSGSSNQASGKSYDPNYQVAVDSPEGGYNPTFVYSMQWGPTFNYTGNEQYIQIPDGIHKINVSATGGGGGVPWDSDGFGGQMFPFFSPRRPHGAQLTGTMDVTPGEVLTVSVGGTGGDGKTSGGAQGGWSTGSYGGGDGANAGGGDPAGGGGGATVIQRADGTIVAVAGGAGGSWGSTTQAKLLPIPHPVYADGGDGEDNMGMAGGNGSVSDDGVEGGKGGGFHNEPPHGEYATIDTGGAGGGGWHGGHVGPGHFAGGGAGSSHAPQLPGHMGVGPDHGEVKLAFAE